MHDPTEPSPATADRGFPPSARLRTSAEFRRVFDRKLSTADATIVLHARENDLGHSRLGLSVSRKVGSAVTRNRWKRVAREAFRLARPEIPSHMDFVLIPRRGARPEFAQVRASLVSLSRRLARWAERPSRRPPRSRAQRNDRPSP